MKVFPIFVQVLQTFRLLWVCPRWSGEAPNKENGCCSWTCDSVSVWTVYETVVTELVGTSSWERSVFPHLPGSCGDGLVFEGKQWNCKPASGWSYTRKRGQTEVRGRADTGTRSDLGGGAVWWLPRVTWHCDSKEWCATLPALWNIINPEYVRRAVHSSWYLVQTGCIIKSVPAHSQADYSNVCASPLTRWKHEACAHVLIMWTWLHRPLKCSYVMFTVVRFKQYVW